MFLPILSPGSAGAAPGAQEGAAAEQGAACAGHCQGAGRDTAGALGWGCEETALKSGPVCSALAVPPCLGCCDCGHGDCNWLVWKPLRSKNFYH